RAGEPATKTVELGVLDSVLKDLSFGKGVSAVKDIVFEWPKGTVPQISEIFLTRGVDASLDGDIEALRDLVAKAKTVDTAAWTTDSVTALDKAVVAAEEALKAPESLTYQQIVDLKAGIEGALSSPVLKYAGTELQQLIDNAVADGSKFTPESWKAYQDALDAAKAGLENADNLSQAEGDRLARELKDALAALVENADQGGSGSGNGGSGNGGAGNGGSGNGGAGNGETGNGGAGNGGQGGNSNGNGANGSTGKPGSSSDKLVQTGDDSLMLIGGTAFAAVALAGAGIALKRRRSNA
ncbi:MAG: FIVAR domain-containing protein, partial [Collinsella intestinalis]|nr:FIVAR domain-containing protein [Collinsella intestinalis]